MPVNVKLVAFKFKLFVLLAIATVDFIASFWLFNKVKARAVVMPFVIMALLKSRLLSEL